MTMVKLQGPAMSLDASGKLANTLVFSKWKGRPYARTLVRPANPKSGMQVGMRAMFKFLSQEWNGLDAADKAAWDVEAAALNVSAFNAYMREGILRWRRFTGPWQGSDTSADGTEATLAASSAVGGPRNIVIHYEVTTVADGWGIMLFRSPTATFDTAVGNCIACLQADAVQAYTYIDSPLAAGAYWYDVRTFTDDGLMGAEEGEFTGTAT